MAARRKDKNLTQYSNDPSFSKGSGLTQHSEEDSWEHCSTVDKSFSFYNHWSFRYLILALVCVVKCTQNYAYEIPSGLEKAIIQTLDVDVARYSLFYSVYSWPNVILPLIGGTIVDRVIGIRLGLLGFMCISLVGQLSFSLGGYFDSFVMMVVSRFVVGVGSQMSLVVSDAFAARWFRGKEIGLMFAIIGIACRMGGVGALYLNSIIFDWFSLVHDKHSRLGFTLLVSFGVLLVATMTTLILVVLDKKGERVLKETSKEQLSDFERKQTAGARVRQYSRNSCCFKASVCCSNNCGWIVEFGLQFWFVGIMFLAFYATFFGFVTTSQLFFISKYGLSVNQANLASVVSYSIPLLSPVIGFLIDQTGFYVSWGLFGGLGILFGGHLLFVLSNGYFFYPFVGNGIIGLGYICFNTAMRAVPTILVSNDRLVTAYGALEVLQSIGYSVTDVVVGVLVDHFGYFAQEIFLLFLVLLGVYPGILIVFCMQNRANKSRLSYCFKR